MILGITPARGGSKRLPRKNVRPLCGRPLLAWTIEAAKASKLLNRYLVSTEDPEIASVSRQWGAEVLDRPAALAEDDTTTLSVVQDILARVPAEVVVLLQATSPIRDADLIDQCIERFLTTKPDSLATGFICKLTPYGSGSRQQRRQDVSGFFCDDGNVYVVRDDLIRRGDWFGGRIEQMVLDRQQNVDIDEEFDLWLAERILERRCYPDKLAGRPTAHA